MGSNRPEPDPVAGVSSQPSPTDFQAIYGEFQPRIHRYLSRLVGRSESEDLTQEVFAKVSQALPGFRGESSVSTWVYRIATNTAFDRMRSPAFQRTRQLTSEIPEAATGPSPGIEHDLARTEMNACLRRYIEALPAGYRSVLLLSEDEGLTNQQIAEALGLTLDTVKIRLHRARARLRARLGSGCDVYRDEDNEVACQPKTGVPPSG
jgi:RNA polymerase sigma-70 factor, ECF subfamily